MSKDPIVATYRLRVAAADAARRAQALAVEQSIEMPPEAVTDARVHAEVLGRVLSVQPAAGNGALARVALATETVGADAGQLLNMLFGNSSLLPDVELAEVELPGELARHFGGPRHGIEGIRRLTQAHGRPLTCTALKPIGASAAQMAALAGTFAAAGIDVIKDDHGWADQASAPFAVRVAACQAAVDEANAKRRDGGCTLYLPSLSGSEGRMREQIVYARDRGVRMVLVAPMVCGAATFHALVQAHPDIAFLAHPALAGAQMAPPALLGRLFRLFGADAVIFPNHGGRFSYDAATCAALAHHLRTPWHGLRAALPTPAGGMSVERVPELVADYGCDSMLLIGGALLAARERLGERAREFVAAVAAAAQPVCERAA
jgi:ribulose-bisphosphate carboxylase large chain